MRILKVLLIPAALALAPAASIAAPASPVGAPEQARTAIEATPAHYRSYYHTHRRYVPPRRYWRGHYRPYRYRPYRYYYGPRCYWSQRWHRRICR